MKRKTLKESIEILEHNDEVDTTSIINLNIFIVMLAVACFILLLLFFNIKQEIKSLPEWECHNETSIEVLTDYWGLNTNFDVGENCYPLDSEIFCERGLRVEEYRNLGKRCIWADGNYDLASESACLIKITKEVCEIKQKKEKEK